VLIESGASDWERFTEVLSSKPAQIGSLGDQGSLKEGQEANITLVDPAASREIQAETLSLSRNNPFAGLTLKGQVVHTLFRGKFSFRDGKVKNA